MESWGKCTDYNLMVRKDKGLRIVGVRTHIVEAVAAAILLLIGLAVVFESRKLGAGG